MEQNAENDAPVASVENADTSVSAASTVENKQKSGKGLKIVTAIACIVAVCGIGFGVYGMIRSFEKDNQIFQKEIFEECYHPIGKEILINKLQEMGYTDIEIKCFPAYFEMIEFERIEWYCVIAKK